MVFVTAARPPEHTGLNEPDAEQAILREDLEETPMTHESRPADPAARDARDEKPLRFIEPRETRRVPLSNLQTEDEARLAAEIEKLLG